MHGFDARNVFAGNDECLAFPVVGNRPAKLDHADADHDIGQDDDILLAAVRSALDRQESDSK
jgi:hypothetical protein